MIPLTYAFLLPSTLAFTSLTSNDGEDGEEVTTSSLSAYVPIPTGEEDDRTGFAHPTLSPIVGTTSRISLTLRDKWILVKPLLLKFMLQLCGFSSRIFVCCLCFFFSACVYLVSSSIFGTVPLYLNALPEV